jgi:hypothetical protein
MKKEKVPHYLSKFGFTINPDWVSYILDKVYLDERKGTD